MREAKDNFTAQSDKYAKYRPVYPADLYRFLFSLIKNKAAAWDCGTGNGQVAMELATFFDKVYATDISRQQIENAVRLPNIVYSVERAENSSFPDNIFGLIAVAQAIHWFNFDNFYKEVNRTMVPGGILAVIGYGLIRADDKINSIIDNFYHDLVGPYWDKERKYIDENYQSIPFPFEEIAAPRLNNNFEWTLEELTGYFETWSAVQHYIRKNNQNPVQLVKKELEKIWSGRPSQSVQFPILLRVAKIKK